MPVARRILHWLVVLVLLWCCAGAVLWQGARQLSYRYVRTHKQHANDTIVVSNALLRGSAELVWVKDDEIRYRGKMFDIKHTCKAGADKTMLIGYYDEHEDELFEVLKKIVGNDEGQSPGQQNVCWLFHAILPSVDDIKWPHGFLVNVAVPLYAERLTPLYRPAIPTPPPDFTA